MAENNADANNVLLTYLDVFFRLTGRVSVRHGRSIKVGRQRLSGCKPYTAQDVPVSVTT